MRGPQLEQIDNHDHSTRRIETEAWDGRREVIDELVEPGEAMARARLLRGMLGPAPMMRRICVVNERTGFTCDEISYEPTEAYNSGERREGE
jgi:hypothetical protein